MAVLLMLLGQFEAAFGCTTREQAYRSSMRSDLVNLRDREEEFHREHGHYTAVADSLPFRAASGVTGLRIERASERGWRARVGHSKMGSIVCSIGIGDAAAPGEFPVLPKEQHSSSGVWPACVDTAPPSPAVMAIQDISRSGGPLVPIVVALAFVTYRLARRRPALRWISAALILFTIAWIPTASRGTCNPGLLDQMILLALILGGLAVGMSWIGRRMSNPLGKA